MLRHTSPSPKKEKGKKNLKSDYSKWKTEKEKRVTHRIKETLDIDKEREKE